MTGVATCTDDEAVADPLEPHLTAEIRTLLEERWWRPIERAARVEALHRTVTALDDSAIPALFADHGVVHVRDVAAGCLDLLDTAQGLLVPRRADERLDVIRAIAVATAYLHDVGMVEPSPARRRIHPQWAAQLVYRPEFDEVIDLLLASDNAMVRRIGQLHLGLPDHLALREVLATSMCHSKTVVPAALLDDPAALRSTLRDAVFADLDRHVDASASSPSPAAGHYDDPERAFAWLTSERDDHRAFAADVVDALRVVRAADALRQRGTTLRTSAGYEIFLDTTTAEAVYAIRTDHAAATTHLSWDAPIAVGEAAVRGTTVTAEGNLRVWFHRVGFTDDAVRTRIAQHAARVVVDVQADVLPTFAGCTASPGTTLRTKDGGAITIELAGDGTGRSFADDVARAIAERRPDLAARLHVVDDELPVAPVDHDEHARFAAGARVEAGSELATTIVARLAATIGTRFDAERAFDDVRLVRLAAGDVLIRPGTAADFVHLPTGPGLEMTALGGYRSGALPAWDLIGVTGVVRQGERNAEVHAAQAVDVVAIPGALFRSAWFHPLHPVDVMRTA